MMEETRQGELWVYRCGKCGGTWKYAKQKPVFGCRCNGKPVRPRRRKSKAKRQCIHAGEVLMSLSCQQGGRNQIIQCDHFGESVSLHPLSIAAVDRIGECSPERTCQGCKVGSVLSPCEVLIVMGPHWAYRRDRFVSAIRDMGICVESSGAKNAAKLRNEIKRRRPNVVFIHTYHVPAIEIHKAAIEFSETTFVSVCHSSLNHLFGKQTAEHERSLDLCLRLPNVWYATPEAIESAYRKIGYERYVQFPNPMVVTNRKPAFVERDPDTVLLSGRSDIVKAFPAASLAAGILANERGVQVMVLTKGKGRTCIEPFLRSAHIKAEWLPWGTCEEFANTMRRRVSLVLQPSLTESFNYVALEAMLEGVPVVGSPTIRFLPPSWQADPNDPESIVRAANEILNNRRQAAELAYAVGRRVAHDQNAALEKLVRKLMVGGQ